MVVLFCVLFFGQEAKASTIYSEDFETGSFAGCTNVGTVTSGNAQNGIYKWIEGPSGNCTDILFNSDTSTTTISFYIKEILNSSAQFDIINSSNDVSLEINLDASTSTISLRPTGGISTGEVILGNVTGNWDYIELQIGPNYVLGKLNANNSRILQRANSFKPQKFAMDENDERYHIDNIIVQDTSSDIDATNFINSNIIWGIYPEMDSVTSSTTVTIRIGFRKTDAWDPYWYYGIEIQDLIDGFQIDTSNYIYGPEYAGSSMNCCGTSGIPFVVKNLTASHLYQYRPWGSATSSMAHRYATSTVYGSWKEFAVVGRAAYFNSAIGTSTQSITASTSPIGYTYNQVKAKCIDAMGVDDLFNVGYDLCLFTGLVLFPSETTLLNFRSIPQEVFNMGPFKLIGDTINWFQILGTDPGTGDKSMNFTYTWGAVTGSVEYFNLNTIAGYAPIVTFRLIFSYLLWLMLILYAFKYLESVI